MFYFSKLKFMYLKDSYFIHHLIKKNYINYWQQIFESQVLVAPDLSEYIYHYHFYVKKLNRWGSNQDRLLLVTNMVKISLILVFIKFEGNNEKG
jgi:hypothetical protein